MISVLQEIIDVLTTVVVGMLTALVMTSVFILFMVYKRNKDFYKPYLWKTETDEKVSDIMLIKPVSEDMCSSDTELNVSKFMKNENLDKLMENERWLNDVSEIIPHCLGILKNCRSLTEKLATLCMGIMNSNGTGMKQIVDHQHEKIDLKKLIVSKLRNTLKLYQTLEASCAVTTLNSISYEDLLSRSPNTFSFCANFNPTRPECLCARQISSRIDDMVSTMYPPLNPQLLEARATALKLAVTQLAIIARYEGGLRKIPMDWMEGTLQDIENHINLCKRSLCVSLSDTEYMLESVLIKLEMKPYKGLKIKYPSKKRVC